MMRRCLCLEQRIAEAADIDWRKALYEYRRWWDSQDIESETDEGWPAEFCFDQDNIEAFADYWREWLEEER
jgi:hypothetical protein